MAGRPHGDGESLQSTERIDMAKHLTQRELTREALRAERRATAALFDGRAASAQVAAEIRAESVVIQDRAEPTESEIQAAAEHVAAGIF